MKERTRFFSSFPLPFSHSSYFSALSNKNRTSSQVLVRIFLILFCFSLYDPHAGVFRPPSISPCGRFYFVTRHDCLSTCERDGPLM